MQAQQFSQFLGRNEPLFSIHTVITFRSLFDHSKVSCIAFLMLIKDEADTPLHLACCYQQLETIELLLQAARKVLRY